MTRVRAPPTLHKRGVVGSSPTFGTNNHGGLGDDEGATGQRVSHKLWLDRVLADRLLAAALRGMADRVAEQVAGN